MLRDLTVQNYRCFENFHIDGLERVNLFVGNNNSGKTTLLETLYLLVNNNHLKSLGEILSYRGEIDRKNNLIIKHIFCNHHINKKQVININSGQGKELASLKIKIEPVLIQLQLFTEVDNINAPYNHTYDLVFISNESSGIKVPVQDNGSIDYKIFRLNKKGENTLFDYSQQSVLFLTTRDFSFSELSILWDSITLTPKENKVINGLQIIEPHLEKINFASHQTSNSGIIAKLKKYDSPVPLGIMGEGMRKILTIIMLLVTAENGVLLVDEIETGLHYEAQTDMWRLILETAKELNVQVFATTHSWDCIAAFQEALSQVEDRSIGKLFRLDNKYGEIRAVEYNAEDLDIAVRNSIEVR